MNISCHKISKSFGGTAALDGLTLALGSKDAPCGEILAIIGPNGAGKTTLLNIITGFLRPDEGRVMLGDQELTKMPPEQIVQAGVARTFQDLRLITLISLLDNVMLARQKQVGESLWRAVTRIGVSAEEEQNRLRAMELLKFIGLEEMATEPTGTLSYGQQKLLTLACCLATDARIILLDEPVAGVHPEMTEKILQLLSELRQTGKLIVFIEHDLSAVRKAADTVIVMDDGHVIAEGPPDEVLEQPEIMEAYVG